MKIKKLVLCFIISMTFGSMALISCGKEDTIPSSPVLYEDSFSRLYDSLGISYAMTTTMQEITKPENVSEEFKKDYEFEYWYKSSKLTQDFQYLTNLYVNRVFDVTSGGIFEGEDLFFDKYSTTCYFWMADKSDEPFSSSLNKDHRWCLKIERSDLERNGSILRILFTRVD